MNNEGFQSRQRKRDSTASTNEAGGGDDDAFAIPVAAPVGPYAAAAAASSIESLSPSESRLRELPFLLKTAIDEDNYEEAAHLHESIEEARGNPYLTQIINRINIKISSSINNTRSTIWFMHTHKVVFCI